MELVTGALLYLGITPQGLSTVAFKCDLIPNPTFILVSVHFFCHISINLLLLLRSSFRLTSYTQILILGCIKKKLKISNHHWIKSLTLMAHLRAFVLVTLCLQGHGLALISRNTSKFLNVNSRTLSFEQIYSTISHSLISPKPIS